MRRESVLEAPLFRLGAFVLLLTLGLGATLALQILPRSYNLTPGSIAPRTISSPRTVSFVSQAATEAARRRAANAVPPTLVFHTDLLPRQMAQLDAVAEEVRAVLDSKAGAAERLHDLGRMEAIELGQDTRTLVASLSVEEWDLIVDEARSLLGESMQQPIRPEEAAQARDRMALAVDPSLRGVAALLAVNLAQRLLVPNLLPDEEATAAARAEARLAVPEQTVTLIQGEVILRDGEVISQQAYEKLDAAGLVSPQVSWQSVAGEGFLALAFSLVLGGYIYFFRPRLLASHRRLLLLGLVLLGAVLGAKLIIPGRDMYVYFFPLAAAPMLIAALLDTQVAVLSAALLAVTVAYVSGYSPQLSLYAETSPLAALQRTTVYFAGSIAGIVALGRAQRMHRFVLAGGAVAAASFGVIVAFWLLDADRQMNALAWYAVVTGANGVITSSLTLGTLFLLGTVFGIATSIHLMELSRPDHPLMQRMALEAPGTYHHSLLVGNLAEQAARAIDADPLLVRVGAYYHDVGKVLRPGYFSENQLAGDNIHDRLEPETSARVVRSHVSDGLQLAQEHRLPNSIRRFIAEHHGDRLAAAFYHRAQGQERTADEEDFRYPGPRPQSRETALVMLADSVEAATRAARPGSDEETAELVDSIIRQRLAEGQLDDCELTLRDLTEIRRVFVAALQGIHHPRVEYPYPVGPGESTAAPLSSDDEEGSPAPPAVQPGSPDGQGQKQQNRRRRGGAAA